MTPEAAIWALLAGQVEAMSLTPALPLLYVAKGGAKKANYAEVAHIPNQNQRSHLADGQVLSRMGILQVTLCAKPGQHEVVYAEKAGQIANHFPDTLRLQNDDACVEIYRTDVEAGFADDTHWRVPVSVYYRSYS